MKKEEKFWNRVSKNYDEGDDVDETYLKMLDIMGRYLKDTDNLMDFGCATGSISIDVSENVRNVIGIDISSEMIRLAKEKAIEHKLENVHFMKSTLFDDRHKDGSYDAIIAFNILHLLDDTKKAIKKINDLLGSGGFFICTNTCLGEKGKLVGGIITLIGKFGIMPVTKKFKTSQLKEMITKGGFEIVEQITFDDPSHPFFVARKI